MLPSSHAAVGVMSTPRLSLYAGHNAKSAIRENVHEVAAAAQHCLVLAMLPLAFAPARPKGRRLARHRHARRRLSGLRPGVRRNHQRDRAGAGGQAAEHQGQHREHSAAGGRQDRSRSRAGRGGAGGPERHRPPAGGPAHPRGHVRHARHVRGARRQRPIAPSTTSRASRSRSAPRARASSSSRATCSTASASIATRTSTRSSSTAPATDREMVMSGKAAALWGAGIGWPGFTAVAKGPAGGRFIVPERRRASRASRPSIHS